MERYRMSWEFKAWCLICLVSWKGSYHLLLTRTSEKEFVLWVFLQKAFFHSRAILAKRLVHWAFLPQSPTLLSSLISSRATGHSLSLFTSVLYLMLSLSLFQTVVPFPTLSSSNILVLSSLQTHLLCHLLHEVLFPNVQSRLLPFLPLDFPDSRVGSNSLYHSLIWSWVWPLSRSLRLTSPSRP